MSFAGTYLFAASIIGESITDTSDVKSNLSKDPVKVLEAHERRKIGKN
jgi:hypothetical protein